MAQLDSASPSEGEGYRFEPCRVYLSRTTGGAPSRQNIAFHGVFGIVGCAPVRRSWPQSAPPGCPPEAIREGNGLLEVGLGDLKVVTLGDPAGVPKPFVQNVVGVTPGTFRFGPC